MTALARQPGASLAWLVATCAACAPGNFDELPSRTHGAQPAECGESEDEPCESDPALDAEPDPEVDAESEPEPEPEDAETDGCTECSDADAESQLDACASCVQPADAGMCIADAGAMCRPDAGVCGGAAPVCKAGDMQMEPRMCGACNTGKQTRTRKCAPDGCSWGAWSDWGACGGVTAACTPGQTTSCANNDECGQRVCSSSCSWGACEPIIAGGCLRIGAGHTDQGSNYRCCNGGKHWQFCLPDCHWSTDCSPCTEGAPNFCSDCY